MNKNKRPYLYFGIYTLIIQAVIWIMFCLYDYGIDEMHWEALSAMGFSEYLVALIIPVPIVSYIILNKRYFSSERPLMDTPFQFLCWTAISLVIGIPIINSVMNRTWFISQEAPGGGSFIDLNGIEYLMIPAFLMLCAALLLLRFIVELAIEIYKRKKSK